MPRPTCMPAPMAAQAGEQHQHVAADEAGKSLHAHMKCCPGGEHAKSDCSQACLQKCFGPLAVMPAGGKAPASAARQFVFAATARADRLVFGPAATASPHLILA